jgi:hypothetical protein
MPADGNSCCPVAVRWSLGTSHHRQSGSNTIPATYARNGFLWRAYSLGLCRDVLGADANGSRVQRRNSYYYGRFATCFRFAGDRCRRR